MTIALRFVYWVPAIAWAGIIFVLSATPHLQIATGDADLILRKIAHLLVYAILCCLVYMALQQTWRPIWHKQQALWGIAICFFYAVFDEVHQTTVVSRNGNLVDVAIDSLGIAVGLAIIAWFSWWRMVTDSPWSADTLTHGSKVVDLGQLPAFSRALVQQFKPGTVVALHGDLGAGKTTLTKHLVQALGITKKVASPTYTITKQYALPNGGMLYHYDWYRLQADEVDQLGFDEVVDRADGIIIIEWPERAQHLLPAHTIHLTLDYVDQRTRKITINR